MTIFLTANNATTTLAGAISPSATTCALAPGTGASFPNPGAGQQFSMTFVDAATGLNNEIVYVTGRSGDTITSMVRAQEGTTAKSWLAGDLANNFLTQGQDAAKAQIPGVQNNTYTYAADTGAANAYAVALSPAPTLAQGAVVGFTASHANTGASTLAVNGGTAYPIWGSAHSAIQGGEIVANGYIEVEYNPTLNGGNPVYILLENTGGATQVAPATQSQHAVQLGQAVGRLLNVQTFTSSGTYTPTAGTTHVKVKLVAGGGGGGGTPSTGAGQVAVAGGGGAGAYAEGYFANSVTQTVTVGAGGLASGASASPGGTGGTTTFGALLGANGGQGGGAGAIIAPPAIVSTGGVGGLPGGTGYININGAAGSSGTILATGNALSGAGGASVYGAAGIPQAGAAGANAIGYGSGASGACGYASSAALSGGGGAKGIVVVEEYA